MLLVKGIGIGVVGYFLDGRHPGLWSSGATRLLGVEGPVGRGELAAVLRGRHPATGQFLPQFRAARRRAGWDLIFAAPKSVSLLAATAPGLGPAEADPTIVAAHQRAVDGALGWLEGRLTVAHPAEPPSGSTGGPGGRPFSAADGLIAAAFTHDRNAAFEPHLHTHVLVANLTRAQDRWWAARSEDWYVNRAAVGALYQLELRHHLRAAGWNLAWRLRPDGLADVADVPRAAVRAASSQAAQVAVHGPFEARRRAVAVPWRERAAGAGFAGVSAPGDPRAGNDNLAGPGAHGDVAAAERAVIARLGAARSDFRRSDVVVALAACHPGGATAEGVDAFVDRICASARPVPSTTSGRRWSTVAAVRLDDQLQRLLDEMTRRPVAAPGPGTLPRQLDPAGQRILGSAAGVVHIGGPVGSGALLAQADVLDACREAWAAAGLTAAIDAAPGAAARWALLSGLEPPPGARPADVTVVDRADRRPTAELLRIAETARSSGSRLILVHGGTMPRVSAPASRGLAAAAASAGYVEPGPHQPWGPSPAGPDRAAGGPPGVAPTGREAAAALLDRWVAHPGSAAPLLVGLGLDEVIGLNRAVRAAGLYPRARLHRGAGPGSGRPARELDADPLGPGDRVVVLHRRGGPAPYGSFGAIRAGRDGPVVHWDDDRLAPAPLDDRLRRGLRPGWAVTAFVAARSDRPLMTLGPAEAAGPARDRVVASVTRSTPERSRGREI